MLSIGEEMTATVRHRGPDDGGHWCDPEAGVLLGHRRLAIIDISPAGAQPMVSANGRYVVAYNGEIYNFRILREELLAAGHTFLGHSDTEVLLAAVVEWGLDPAIRRFVGMFAFSLWDRERRALHLCRDRVGEKPLYYGWSGGTLLFASELKALRVHPDWRGKVDRESLGLFLRYNYVPTPRCIYEGIHKLPPGTYVTASDCDPSRELTPTTYWSMQEAAERADSTRYAGNAESAIDELDRLLRITVSQQMVADVPVGAFLSGGLDSSLIVSVMQAESPTPVRTYTIGFSEREFDEAPYARAIARHLGTDHTELMVGQEETLRTIPHLPSIYDEPFADSCQIPTFLVSQLARADVKVSLSGDGGDELFGGYSRYLQVPRLWELMRWIPASARGRMGRAIAAAAPAPAVSRPRLSRLSNRATRVGELLRCESLVDVYDSFILRWHSPGAVVLGAAADRNVAARLPAWRAENRVAQQMMDLDSTTYLPDDLLVKLDRAAMAVSLETRAPLLDHRIVEFVLSLPTEMKMGPAGGKLMLRRLVGRYIPPALTDRPKMGFMVPVARWLRGPLRDWAESLLDERRLREEGFFEAAPIRTRWRQHLDSTHDWQYSLWCVLMFQAWLDASGPQR